MEKKNKATWRGDKTYIVALTGKLGEWCSTDHGNQRGRPKSECPWAVLTILLPTLVYLKRMYIKNGREGSSGLKKGRGKGFVKENSEIRDEVQRRFLLGEN
jgi:hypothetical protein